MSKKYGKNTTVPRTDGLLGQKFKPITETQFLLQESISNNIITFVYGSAGTGKTYCATNIAAEALFNRQISRIVLTRPAVTAGENFGYLPGELKDKYAVYLEAFESIFISRFGVSHYQNLLGNGRIAPKPLAFMRSTTLEDCIVLVDEAQNITKVQMELILTRIGENCKVIVSGDLRQSDIRTNSGLEDAIWRLEGLAGVGVVQFDNEDVVRSGIVKEIVRRYEYNG